LHKKETKGIIKRVAKVVTMKKMSPTDKEYLEKLRNKATEVRTFLSNKPGMKPERERSVCRAFLRTLGIPFKDSEVIAPANGPVDVMFREARFQIKDMLEPDHKRGDVSKNRQHKYKIATSIDEAIDTDLPPTTPVDLNALIPEVTAFLSKYVNKYATTRQDLDMLIYLDFRKRFLAAESAVPNVESLKAQGWRSVSLLFPPYGVVLFAKPEAPDFLIAAEAKLYTYKSFSGPWDCPAKGV
jgi:hypothetical protein